MTLGTRKIVSIECVNKCNISYLDILLTTFLKKGVIIENGKRKIMNYYTAITIINIILMVAMSIHVLSNTVFNKKQKGWFISTFAAISFCALAEYALHCGYYDSVFDIPLTILTVLQFAIAPCFAMLFAGALGLKHQGKIAICYFAICLLAGIICAPFGWIFYFDAEGYHRGVAFLIYEITYFASLAYIIVILFITGRKFSHRDIGTIIMIFVVLAAGIIPMSIYQLHVAYVAVGISSCLCYVFYNDLIQQDMSVELLQKQQRITDMQVQITARLANLIESRDTETGEHVARTSAYVKNLAEDCLADGVYTDQINQEFIDLIFMLAPMHDVGKILVSDKILRKPGKLTPEEYEEIKKHAMYGGDVVKQILNGIADDDYIKFASDIAIYHHERWDGKGYSHGLKEEEIPLSARMMAIADVFDALVSKRCYKEAIPVEEAFKIIEDESGTHFDPKLVKVFLDHKEKYIEINSRIIG